MKRVTSIVTLTLLALFAVAAHAHAQAGAAASIAGTVKDTSGAVLPGVTVEASSPALIEKVRTVTSDDQGNFKVVDLRPGIYTVTFTLAGFRTVRREGLEVTTGVTQQANADMQVGALEETVTVTGASPVVDVQNVLQQSVFKRDVQEALPLGRNIVQWAAVIPGATLSSPANQDVGGTGPKSSYVGFHGMNANTMGMMQDGMLVKPAEPAAFGLLINPAGMEEVQLEVANASAEISSGTAQMNVVPREGGNTFKFSSAMNYTDGKFQSSNVTPELRARGVAQTGDLNILRVINFGLGGPVIKDKLWFYTAHQWSKTGRTVPGSYFNATQDSWLFTPDPSRPAFTLETDKDDQVRFTWQATPKNKITFHQFYAGNCQCYFGLATSSPEAAARILQSPTHISQAAWRFPATNRMLWDAGVTMVKFHSNKVRQPGVSADTIAVTELSRGVQYRAYVTGFVLTGSYGDDRSNQVNEHLSLTYVTGSHAVKSGIALRQDWRADEAIVNKDISYSFLNGVPQSIVEWASPSVSRDKARDLGVFVQDQWKVKNVTLNLGVRFDYFRGFQTEQTLPAGRFVPERTYAGQDDIPNWKDITPRLGAAWDLFGNGKTALKAALNKYVDPAYAGGTTAQFNPVATTVVSVSRTWNDANRDFNPDCVLENQAANGECGPISNTNFGKTVASTRFADDVRYGWGTRPFTWQSSVGIQQELWPGAGINVGYFRTWFGNFTTTQNVLVTPADYDPFCITLPTDSRLPNSGQQLCGLYDIKLSAFGRVSNLITQTSNFGEQSQVFNGIDATLNMRMAKGTFVTGGVSTGATVRDNCKAIVNSPQNLFCHSSPPWSAGTQVKLSAIYPLPADFRVSATFQNLPGIPIAASYVATNAQIAPSLGRNLAACGAAATCSASVTVPNIFDPVITYEDRISQVDVRLTRNFQYRGIRVQGNFDLYNILNASSVLATNPRYGASWLQPTTVLGGRLFKFGFQLDL